MVSNLESPEILYDKDNNNTMVLLSSIGYAQWHKFFVYGGVNKTIGNK